MAVQRYPEHHTAFTFGTEEEPTVRLNAELLGTCRRALWHHARGDPRDNPRDNRPGGPGPNPGPDTDAPPYLEHGTRLQVEAALRQIALDALRAQGWSVHRSMGRSGEYGAAWPRPRVMVFGAPDAVASHPERTGGLAASLTVRTEWRENPGDPAHAMRAAFCRRSPPKGGPDRPGGEVHVVIRAADAAVRTGRPTQEETIGVQRETGAWLAGMQQFLGGAPGPDDLPERDFPAESAWCRQCPWLTACRGAPEQGPAPGPQGGGEARKGPGPRGA